MNPAVSPHSGTHLEAFGTASDLAAIPAARPQRILRNITLPSVEWQRVRVTRMAGTAQCWFVEPAG